MTALGRYHEWNALELSDDEGEVGVAPPQCPTEEDGAGGADPLPAMDTHRRQPRGLAVPGDGVGAVVARAPQAQKALGRCRRRMGEGSVRRRDPPTSRPGGGADVGGAVPAVAMWWPGHTATGAVAGRAQKESLDSALGAAGPSRTII